MRTKLLPKGGMYGVNLGYNVKMEIYANAISDITKLSDITD